GAALEPGARLLSPPRVRPARGLADLPPRGRRPRSPRRRGLLIATIRAREHRRVALAVIGARSASAVSTPFQAGPLLSDPSSLGSGSVVAGSVVSSTRHSPIDPGAQIALVTHSAPANWAWVSSALRS